MLSTPVGLSYQSFDGYASPFNQGSLVKQADLS